jgi:hypothetical protein
MEELEMFEEKVGDRASGDLSLDLEARLHRRSVRAQRLKWENAKWWRVLNRFMCAVGVVLIVLIIILAVLDTRKNWT